MKSFLRKTILFGLFFFGFTCVAHANPVIATLILDASGSVSEQDFRTMNKAGREFIDEIYEISQTRPGQRADWVSVAWFGGRDQYRQTPYINGSNKTQLDVITSEMRTMRHPNYGNTAIYSALLKGTLAAAERDSTLPGQYGHIMILVTDGQENHSPQEIKHAVRQLYPNDAVFLAIVAVGGGVSLDYVQKEFGGIADHVQHIENFDALVAVLSFILRFAR